MKLKVTNDFTDKNDNKLYKKGQVIEVTEKRAKEILNSPYNVAEELPKEDNSDKNK